MKIILVFWIGLFPYLALASQVFNVSDGDRVSVVLSKNELTRIKIEGAGKITDVRGATSTVAVEADKKNGEIYVKPISLRENYSFFLSDSYGNTYTINVSHSDIPSQTIILKPKTKNKKNNYKMKAFKALPLKEKIARLGKAMALDLPLDGFDFTREKKPIKIRLWKEVDFALIRTYVNDDFKGEVFVLTNISDTKMILHEKEMMTVGKDVIAASIAKHQLDPKETTFVYLVKEM